MDKLMMLLRPFLKKELLDIIYIHPVGDDGIYKYIPKESFPIEDGGAYKTREAIRGKFDYEPTGYFYDFTRLINSFMILLSAPAWWWKTVFMMMKKRSLCLFLYPWSRVGMQNLMTMVSYLDEST